MKVLVKDLTKKFSYLEILQGDVEAGISNPSDAALATKNSIVFVHSHLFLEEALSCAADTLVIQDKLKTKELVLKSKKNILICQNVLLAKAQVCRSFFNTNEIANKNSTPASVGKNCNIDSSVCFGPGVHIGDNVTINKSCVIGANTNIESDVSIGESTVIYPIVYIGQNTLIGKQCEVLPNTTIGKPGYGYATDENKKHFRVPHYGRLVIKDYVHIGSGNSIDRGAFGDTLIGENTKIDNHCHIAHNVQIGENSQITAGFIVAGSTIIGKNFACGGRVSVCGHTKICDDVTLMAMSVVVGAVKKPGTYSGYPLLPHKDSLKAIASIAKLPEMRRQLRDLKNKLFN